MEFLKAEIDDRFNKKEVIPSVITITETHLKAYVEDAQVHLPGYNLVKCDRSLRTDGGILMYVCLFVCMRLPPPQK